MKAFLYYIKFYTSNEADNPLSVKEFIVFGSSQKVIDAMAAKVFDHYKQSINKPYEHYKTGGRLPVSLSLRGKQIKKPIDWNLLQHLQKEQEQIRPRDQGGSIFHYLCEEDQQSNPVEYRKMLRDYIDHFFSHEQTVNKNSKFIFVGSTWDDSHHKRSGEVSIIEASNLKAAGYICDLIFLKRMPITTQAQWCIPIFDANDEIGD